MGENPGVKGLVVRGRRSPENPGGLAGSLGHLAEVCKPPISMSMEAAESLRLRHLKLRHPDSMHPNFTVVAA